MSETIEHFKLNGCEKVPDHSILIWESEIIPLSSANDRNEQNAFTSRKLFNVSNIPTDFLNNGDAANLIHRTVERIERSLPEANGANDAYSAFTDLINSEMNAKLKCVSHAKSFNSKGNRMRSKKYWNNELQLQWNKVCEKERLWLKCTNSINRNVLKANYCAERRRFDQMNRRYKRQHQRTAQEKLHDLLQNDTTRDFWKEIGKLSLANERKSKLPMEVVDPEGHSIFDQDQVLEKWKTDYSNLLNSESSKTFDEEHYEIVLRQLRENSVTNNGLMLIA